MAVARTYYGKRSKAMSCDIIKSTQDPYGHLYSKDVENVLNEKGRISAIVGHCRSATIGEINVQNAHPYRVNNIVGVHNGTIPSLSPKDKATGTDSSELYKLIEEKGIDAAIGSIQFGAYALVYLDTAEGTINFLRNEQRQLWMMQTKSGGTIYWASERGMLSLIAERESVVFDEPSILPTNKLLTIKLPNIGDKSFRQVDAFKPPIVTPQILLPPPAKDISCLDPSLNRRDLSTMVEDKEVSSEQEDIPFLPSTLPERLVRPFNQEQQRVVPGLGTQPLLEFPTGTSKFSIDSARFLFNNGHYPCVIKYTDGTIKTLRYRMPSGLCIQLAELKDKLKEGCCMSKQVLKDGEESFWINNHEYVCRAYIQDDFLREYLMWEDSYKKPMCGRYVYGTVGQYLSHNAQVTKTVFIHHGVDLT